MNEITSKTMRENFLVLALGSGIAVPILYFGIQFLAAPFFPLSDPRHNSNLATVGLFLFPILLTFALWKLSNARLIKTYLISTSFLGIVSILIMSGASGLNTQGYEGLLQGIVALFFMVPIGVSAYFLLKRSNLNVVSSYKT